MADAEPAPSLATSLARLNTAMANLAIAQVSMDSNLHASHFRLEALQASMLSKLDLIILRLDTMISHQRSPFRSSVQLPPPLSPLFPPLAQPPLPPPAPPSNASSYHPSQYPHQPRFHVPPPMAGQRDSHAIGIDSSTIDFPVSVWQHHRADINRHFRTNPRWYHKIPYDNDIFLLGDVIVGHQIRSRWIWILFATETPFCSVRHRRQRPSPHPPPPPKPPPPPSSPQPCLTPSLTAPQHMSHTLLQTLLLLGPNQPTNKATSLTYLLFPKLTLVFACFLLSNLKDKVVFRAVGVDSNLAAKHHTGHIAEAINWPRRVSKKPTYLQDFV